MLVIKTLWNDMMASIISSDYTYDEKTGELRKRRRLKYGNKPCWHNGIKFDSKKERDRFIVLLSLRDTGNITDLRVHEKFPLMVGEVKIGTYAPDFIYINDDGKRVAEDVKGGNATKTPLYRWKKKHFCVQYREYEFKEI